MLMFRVVVLCAAVVTCASVSPDDVVRARFVAGLLPTSADGNASAVATASKWATLMAPNGTWADINYADKSRAVWSPSQHTARCLEMAVGYVVGGNATVLDAIHTALGTWLKLDPQSDNWWFNQINTPQDLSNTCVLLEKNVLPSHVDGLVTIMKRAKWQKWTGANLVWMVFTQIRRGLFTGNDTAVSGGFARLWEEMVVVDQPSDGIQADHSYHQHGPELLAGSYGSVFTGDLLTAVVYAQGTPFQPADDNLAVFAAFIAEGQARMIRRQTWDPSVVGRQVSRPGADTVSFPGLDALAALVPAYKDQLLAFSDRLGGKPSAAPVPSGGRYYYDSDYANFHNGDFLLSVHMFSNRTIAARCVNEEAKIAQHTSDGFVSLMYSGEEYNEMGGLWDYRGLPGTTVEQNTPLLPCSWEFPVNHTSFVGGVSDVEGFLCGQNLSSNALLAQKSFHVHDGSPLGFMVMGTLTCDSNNPVYTTLASRLLNGPVTVMFAGGSTPTTLPAGNATFSNVTWIHHDNTVYSVPPKTTLRVFSGTETQNWSRVGVSTSNVTAEVFTAQLDHGAALASAMLTYAVVPNVSVADAPSALAAFSASVSASTAPTVHASWSTSMLRVATWGDAAALDGTPFGTVTVSSAAFVTVTSNATSVTVTAASPEPATTELVVTLSSVVGSGSGCAGSGSGTSVTLDLSGGDSVGKPASVTCSTA